MSIQPSQVKSRADGHVLVIERLVNARHIPTPERMRLIAEEVASFSAAVEGSTHDPLRNMRPTVKSGK